MLLNLSKFFTKTIFLINLRLPTNTLSMKVQILIPFLIYLLLLVVIGIYTMRSVAGGMSSFFLGEKKMNRFVIAVSSAVSARGAWMLMGITTQAYVMGLSAIWIIAGFLLSEFLLFIFVAPRIRKYSEENNCLTLTDLFTSRFKSHKKSLRIIIATTLLFFSLCFISSQFLGGGNAFYAFFGLSSTNGIIITGVIVLVFTFLGGFKTLTYSDLFQAFVIICVLLILPIFILIRREGFENIHADILYGSPDFFSLKALSMGTFFGFLSIGLGSFGNPNILIKNMSVKTPLKYPIVAFVNILTSVLIAIGALCTGVFARVYFPLPDSIPGADSQNVYIGLAGAVFSPIMLGIVLTSIFAALISASGSQILISASTVARELYEKTLMAGKHISQVQLAFYSRIAIVVGIIIDTDFNSFVLFSLAGLGASIGPAIIVTLFWKGVTSGGIGAGVLTGGLTVIFWKCIPILSDNLYELIPGFILGLLAIWFGSKIDKKLASQKYNRKASYEDIKKAGSWE
jgi:sodium/proline symporter